MKHIFDTEVAGVVGIPAAVIYENICFWVRKNTRTDTNKREGKYWTFFTLEQLCGNFPYMSNRTIQRAINALEKNGYIIKGNFNKNKFDRTVWYTVNGEMHFAKMAKSNTPNCRNGDSQNGEMLYKDIKTDIKEDVSHTQKKNVCSGVDVDKWYEDNDRFWEEYLKENEQTNS